MLKTYFLTLSSAAAFAVTLSIAGCAEISPAEQPSAIQGGPTASTKTLSPALNDPPSLGDQTTDDVRIRLKDEPRLQAPVATNVAPTKQQFTLDFREAMDQASVEAALLEQAKQYTEKEEAFGDGIVPSFDYRWVNDRELDLTVGEISLPEPTFHSYQLSVSGAKTKSGRMLGETPTFKGVVERPNQLWKMSVDSKSSEPLTSFDPPYGIEMLDDSGKFLLLSRTTHYCRCDAPFEGIYTVYDVKEKKLIPYPNKLMTRYMGSGAFVADRRGFFYEQPEQGTEIPASDTAVAVRLNDYVHGAGFSKDRTRLIMAVGTREQERDLDLLVFDLKSGKEQRMSKALVGSVPFSQTHSGRWPVGFEDDGERVYVNMDVDTGHEKRYVYTWKTGKLEPLHLPLSDNLWGGFIQTTDGVYQFYYNAGIYKGAVKISKDRIPGGDAWITGTHLLLRTQESPGAPKDSVYNQDLVVFDADKRAERKIVSGVWSGTSVAGSSPDGKWIYLISGKHLTKP
ncbi:hypothetical protein SAMN04487970_101426 [Paenibacillus tianmuensis]|uniref:SbsA Ig-like domain-containing protein n=1 Tax=Paenibacillus tianmuensis TaxID=624147 RepID=A0A1G4RCB4_9BACL|nr:hypothetical protein SAMN04487970_101426 [Paenibacillus tianmuensis]